MPASGTFTVGSGGDYATWAAAVAAITSPLTGNLTFNQISDTTEPGCAARSIDLAGHTLTLNSNSPHAGDPTAGHVSTMTAPAGPTMLYFSVTGTGLCEIKNLRISLVTSGAGVTGAQIRTLEPNIAVHDCIVLHNGSTGNGLEIQMEAGAPSTVDIDIWNNVVAGGAIGLRTDNPYGGSTIVENCSAYGSGYGFSFDGTAVTARNCVAAACATAGFLGHGSATGENNACDDASVENANWGAGTGNISPIVPANEFVSTSTSNSNFLKVKLGGSLDDGGDTTLGIVANTVGIRGNARPHSAVVSIGADEYQVLAAAPTVTSTGPAAGSYLGGTSVSVYGANFVSGATVKFDGTLATGITFIGSGQIDCVTPVGTPGPADVVVTNPDTQFDTLAGGFTYAGVSVTSVSPSSGQAAGSEPVSVYGSNFVSGAGVTFDGAAATGVTFVDSGQIDCVTPAGTTGDVDVIVTNPDTQSGTLVDGFTYLSVPAPTSVTPDDGPAAGEVSVTIGGTGFVATPTVTFGAVAATGVVWVSATELTCVIPAGEGVVDITVTNPDTGYGTLVGGFSYIGSTGVLLPVEIPTQIGEGGMGVFRSSPGLGDVLNKIAVCLQFIQSSAAEATFAEFKLAMEDLVPPTYTPRRRYVTAYPASDTDSIRVSKRTGEGDVGLNRAQTAEQGVGLKDILDRVAQMITEIQVASQLADYAAFKAAVVLIPDLVKSADSRV